MSNNFELLEEELNAGTGWGWGQIDVGVGVRLRFGSELPTLS